MKRLISYSGLLGIILVIPVFNYLFLDQVYETRFLDFATKLVAREKKGLTPEKIMKLLRRYETVADASSDIASFGFLQNGISVYSYGKKLAQDSALAPGIAMPRSSDTISSESKGLLQYRIYIQVPNSEATSFYIYFDFLDSTAYSKLLVRMLLSYIILGLILIVLRYREIQRIRTIRNTMILTMRRVAHDLRTPFSKLSQILPALDSNPTLRKDMSLTFNHVDELLHDFLDLDHRTPASPFDAKLAIDRIRRLYGPSWEKERGIAFEFVSDDALTVLGNERKFLRIVSNLLDNAFRHARSLVKLEALQRDNELILRVSNDGDRIPSGKLKSIFNPLSSYQKSGYGLGLFICENFARSMEGRVWCSSDDKQTHFYLSVPMAKKAEGSVAAKLDEPGLQKQDDSVNKSGGAFKIAFIDDEPFYKKNFAAAIKDSPLQVRFFDSTDDFLMLLHSGKYIPNLVIVDRFGPSFDAVADRFPESCRDFGFLGPLVLYSNSIDESSDLSGFFEVIDKGQIIDEQSCLRIMERFQKNGT